MTSIKNNLLLIGLVIFFSGCMTDSQFLDENKSAAIDTTVSRAKFELNCKNVEPVILSEKVTQIQFADTFNRTEYTIGVKGCGKQATYIAFCLNPDNCNAIADTANIEN